MLAGCDQAEVQIEVAMEINNRLESSVAWHAKLCYKIEDHGSRSILRPKLHDFTARMNFLKKVVITLRNGCLGNGLTMLQAQDRELTTLHIITMCRHLLLVTRRSRTRMLAA